VVHGEANSVKHRGDENDNGIGERDFREAKRKFEVAYLSRHWRNIAGTSRAPLRRSGCTGRACKRSCASWVSAGQAGNA